MKLQLTYVTRAQLISPKHILHIQCATLYNIYRHVFFFFNREMWFNDCTTWYCMQQLVLQW